MSDVRLKHFEIAAADLGAHGDNDTLPFDIDIRFIKDCQKELAKMAHEYFVELDKATTKDVTEEIGSLQIFSERLLVPTGSAGFRITTKLDPFWNVYFNGLGVAIAQKNERRRSTNAHSYRYDPKESGLPEWTTGILLNPRRNQVVEISFNELINIATAGKSKIEILELFSSIIGDYALKALPEFRL